MGTKGGGTGVFGRCCVESIEGGGVGGSSILVTLIDCNCGGGSGGCGCAGTKDGIGMVDCALASVALFVLPISEGCWVIKGICFAVVLIIVCPVVCSCWDVVIVVCGGSEVFIGIIEVPEALLSFGWVIPLDCCTGILLVMVIDIDELLLVTRELT